MTTEAIRYEKDAEGIVTLTIDLPGHSANVMNATYRDAMAAAVERLQAEREQISGVIVASAKKTFFAGGDLDELRRITAETAADFGDLLDTMKAQFRTLETLGRPVVACINGAALGGGWELALACHHRICLDDERIKLGLPEVTLGLLPGAGGVTRMVRLLGLEQALPLLLEGKQFGPAKAQELGLVHALVAGEQSMREEARAWIRANPEARQPWDVKGYRIPGGAPSHPKLQQMLPILPSMLRKKTKGCYPAPEKTLAAAVEGAQVNFDTATRIETRYLLELITGPVTKNMINAFWFDLNAIKAGRSRPQPFERYSTHRVGVLGAGMMGAGIAHVSALAGIEVVLKDVSLEAAERGKQHSAELLAKRVAAGRMSAQKREQVLALIRPSADEADFEGCDLVIEAVFENRELKNKVTAAAERAALPDAVIASNTSTLPITGLAEAVPDAKRFVGLHFFSPVDKMPLVEIIRGRETDDATLARAFDYVMQIRKTPIVVNDGRGFYTSRVFGTFAQEGIAMVREGVPAALIENIAQQSGMPVGPLAVCDEVSLSLLLHIRRQTEQDLAAEGQPFVRHPADPLIAQMVEEFERPGRAAGGGFYEYPAAGRKHLWAELKSRFERPEAAIAAEDVRDRLLFVQALETVRCVEDGILTSSADANIGSIFGWGFAAWSGGTLQFINQYGLERFADRARYLAERYGERFAPPELLLEKAARGETF